LRTVCRITGWGGSYCIYCQDVGFLAPPRRSRLFRHVIRSFQFFAMRTAALNRTFIRLSTSWSVTTTLANSRVLGSGLLCSWVCKYMTIATAIPLEVHCIKNTYVDIYIYISLAKIRLTTKIISGDAVVGYYIRFGVNNTIFNYDNDD